MFSASLDIHAVLSSALAFHRLSDEGLAELADLAEVVTLRRGQALFREGSRADAFYVIASGCVELSRRGRGGAYREARLSTGESMGLETLTTRVWGSTAIAQADSVLVAIPALAFSRWAAHYPEIKTSLELDRDTRRLARDAGLDFLQEDETIFFIARKHPIFLFGRLIVPVLLAAICVFAFAFLYFSPYGELPLAFPAAGLLLGCSVLWFVWNLLDWINDYSIVTAQRLIWLERIAGFYDSRQEAPLSTVQSVNVRCSQLGRIFDYGDVVIRTYTGTVVFKAVGKPRQVAALVEDYWFQAKASSRRAEAIAMEQAIRERLGLAEPTSTDPDEAVRPSVQSGQVPTWFATLLHMRYEAGGVITYRKHWFVLIQQTWKPLFWLLVTVGIALARIFEVFTLFSVMAIVLVCGLIGIGLFGWLVYEYLDWRNDLFLVTAEQVVDMDRKPFGKEEKRSAPLENILSIQYQRLGLLGLIFNFGTVYITVGNSTLTFDTVFDPSQVQQDIFKRMAERSAAKKRQEMLEQRDRVTDWFASYAQIQKETGNQSPDVDFSDDPDSDLF